VFVFTQAHQLRDEPNFDPAEVLNGVTPDPSWRDAPGRVWVEVDGQADSLRVYGGPCFDASLDPIIFLEGDSINRQDPVSGTVTVGDLYSHLSPFHKQSEAEQYTGAFLRPFINLARPGVFGSSGDHRHRRRPREVALIDAALDALRDHFGWRRLHLAGQSGGGHLVACLIARRSDIGCAVIASGNVAVRRRNELMGLEVDRTGYADFVDPIDLVADVARHPPERIVVLTDRDDAVVAASTQQAYVDALRGVGVPVSHRMIWADDPRHHGLRLPAMLAAAAGANADRLPPGTGA
jgi:dienelactone hydrolase